MRIRTALVAFVQLVYLVTSLLWIWITLDWKVRQARQAFERELIKQKVSKEKAKRLSNQIKVAKDEMMSSLWQLAFK